MRSTTRQGGTAALALVVLFTAGTLASAEGWGTVKGKVTYKDKQPLPKNPAVNVTADKAFCTKDGKLTIHKDEWVVYPKTRGIKNVIVWLSPLDKEKSQTTDWDEKLIHPDLKAVPKKHEVDQPGCQFMPRVIVLREGSDLVFKNSASVSHNVRITELEINSSIPPGKDLPVGSVKARFRPMMYDCTIHPWMRGWLISFKHPYYAVTNEKGEFEIKNAPAGKFRLQIWQEGFGYVQKKKDDRGVEITIKDKDTTTVNQQLIEDTGD